LRANGYNGQAVTGYALKLSPLVFVRPGELRHAVPPLLKTANDLRHEADLKTRLRLSTANG
jgi:hypothetical protein